jgi:thiazole synthase ThiGH ThiG subunit
MELAIKKNINKLPEFVPDIKMVTDQLLNNGFELLQLTNEHIFSLQNLRVCKINCVNPWQAPWGLPRVDLYIKSNIILPGNQMASF